MELHISDAAYLEIMDILSRERMRLKRIAEKKKLKGHVSYYHYSQRHEKVKGIVEDLQFQRKMEAK